MVSIVRQITLLQQKKQEAAKLRRKGEREFKKAKSIAQRSISGLATLQRRIETSKEQLEDVSGVLTQRMAQHDSIQRLIAAAQQNLKRENEAKEQAEQELEFADSEEEKQRIQERIKIMNERIGELDFEIKNRSKMTRKILDSINEYKKSSSQLSQKIHKNIQSKPTLKQLIQKSKKATKRLEKQVVNKTKQEESAKRNLSKINKLAKLTTKPKTSKLKTRKLKSKGKKSQRKLKSKPKKSKLKTRKLKSKGKKSKK